VPFIDAVAAWFGPPTSCELTERWTKSATSAGRGRRRRVCAREKGLCVSYPFPLPLAPSQG
jgi:hypothetical protein